MGEILAAAMRQDLEQMFKCPVRNHYGAVGLGRLAVEDYTTSEMYLNEVNDYLNFLVDASVPDSNPAEKLLQLFYYSNPGIQRYIIFKNKFQQENHFVIHRGCFIFLV